MGVSSGLLRRMVVYWAGLLLLLTLGRGGQGAFGPFFSPGYGGFSHGHHGSGYGHTTGYGHHSSGYGHHNSGYGQKSFGYGHHNSGYGHYSGYPHSPGFFHGGPFSKTGYGYYG